MKIAVVTNKIESTGGVQVFTRDLSHILRERGHIVSVIGEESLPPERREDLAATDLEVTIGEFFNDLNKVENFDVAICNGEMGYAVNHPRAINVFHGNYYGYATAVQDLVPPELTKQRLVKAELQRVSAQGKYVITISDFSVQGLKESDIKVDKVIKLSVDTSKFHPRNIDVSNTALAICRGMKYEKGLDIIEALADRGVNIRLFSDRTIDSPHVENMGLRDNEGLPQEYNQAQLFLNPTRFEGGGLTTLEALASGCPVLTTPTGYGFDIKRHIPNFVVADPEDLNEYLAKHNILVNDRQKYSKQALDYFHTYHNPETFKKDWIKVVENLQHVRQT